MHLPYRQLFTTLRGTSSFLKYAEEDESEVDDDEEDDGTQVGTTAIGKARRRKGGKGVKGRRDDEESEDVHGRQDEREPARRRTIKSSRRKNGRRIKRKREKDESAEWEMDDDTQAEQESSWEDWEERGKDTEGGSGTNSETDTESDDKHNKYRKELKELERTTYKLKKLLKEKKRLASRKISSSESEGKQNSSSVSSDESNDKNKERQSIGTKEEKVEGEKSKSKRLQASAQEQKGKKKYPTIKMETIGISTEITRTKPDTENTEDSKKQNVADTPPRTGEDLRSAMATKTSTSSEVTELKGEKEDLVKKLPRIPRKTKEENPDLQLKINQEDEHFFETRKRTEDRSRKTTSASAGTTSASASAPSCASASGSTTATAEVPTITLRRRSIESDMQKLEDEIRNICASQKPKLRKPRNFRIPCKFFNLSTCRFVNVFEHRISKIDSRKVAHMCAFCHWVDGSCDMHNVNECPNVILNEK